VTVVATGSIAYDYILTYRGRFAEHILPEKAHVINLSFLVDSMQRRRGGVATNYAYTLALLGQPVAVLATIGPDGRDIKNWLQGLGVDCSGVRVIEGEFTATGFTTTDLDDNQITGYFGGAMLKAGQLGLQDTVADPAVVIVGPNAPDAMSRLVAECRSSGTRWVFDPAHQLPHMSPAALETGSRGAWILIGNDYEIELVKQRTDLGDAGLLELAEMVVTTLGREGSTIHTRDGQFFIPPAPVKREADPVGAGDAYRAGLIHGLLSGHGIETSGRIASVAAAYVVEQTGTVEHAYTRSEFAARFEAAYQEELLSFGEPAANPRSPIAPMDVRPAGARSGIGI
jgi:adenosine kinase